ncbi:MAG: tetratricopeptide repeat protein [Clostridia bacterium]|jgi:tetratricopeptide (TPR) repeat protein|nr:tetratricopeptide repeat protein [Clostridia bacterium]
MLIEKIIFNVLAFSFFIFIFFKMIRKNDTNYLFILVIQVVGITINFLEIIFNININIFMKSIIYICSVIIPILVIIVEHRNINFSELIFLSLAKISIFINKPKMAKKFLINLVSKYPESYFGHKLLAELYEKEGGMRKAIDEYVQVIDINKKDYNSYYKISYLLYELDKKEESSQMLETLLQKKPDFKEATQLLGDIYHEQERYKEAINIYNEALKYNPNDYDLYYNMGMVYTMLNDFQNAKICYEKAAQINTLLYNSYYKLAQISLIYNDLEEAEKFFLRSTMSEDIEPKAYYHLAKICILKGDKDNAIKYINVAIDIDHSLYKKAEEEPLFITIKTYINFPDMEEEQKITTKLTKKEKKAQQHLEKTTKLVGKLSRNELKLREQKNTKIIDIEKENEK